MKFSGKFISLITVLVLSDVFFGQQNEVSKYNTDLRTSTKYSLQKMEVISKSKNTYEFMSLGYFINANNNMYLKTKDKKYIDDNIAIIKPILIDVNSNTAYQKNGWIMNVGKHNQNASVNGQEHLISEGYFFRYVGEFLDIISNNNLYKDYQNSIFKGLKYSFTKWKDRSFNKYNDYSLLFHQRLHTGANWATVALYLNKYDSKNRSTYLAFINQFDNQLNKALQLKEENGKKYYIWNSTYPERFCAILKGIKNYNPVIQDVSHGNHVVLYLLKAKELNNTNWKGFNFSYLVNTLEIKILKNNSIADNVDGSSSNTVKNTGWKISDGWMKLIYIDNNLYPLFQKSLHNYQSIIKSSFLETQFNSIYL